MSTKAQAEAIALLRDAHTSIGRVLDAFGANEPVDDVMTAPLGPLAERVPSWLVAANDARRAAHPSGYVGPDGPDFDGDPDTTSRAALVLISALIDPRAAKREDLTDDQRAAIQQHCNVRAWGNLRSLAHRDEVTHLLRLPVTWAPVDPDTSIPGAHTLAVPPNAYTTEDELKAAVLRLYDIAYGPLQA